MSELRFKQTYANKFKVGTNTKKINSLDPVGNIGITKSAEQKGLLITTDFSYEIWFKNSEGNWNLNESVNSSTIKYKTISWGTNTHVYFKTEANSGKMRIVGLTETASTSSLRTSEDSTSGFEGGKTVDTLSYDNNELKLTLNDNTELKVNIDGGIGGQEYNSDLDGNTIMTQPHGALPQGTKVSDLSDGVKTLSDLMDSILFPTAYPTYSQPSASLQSLGGLKKIGSTSTITLTTGANRGSINNPWDGSTQGSFAGPITGAYYTQNGGSQINLSTTASGVENKTINDYAVLQGTNAWYLNVSFSDGQDPVDSTGSVISGDKYSANSATASRSFEGVYPIFKGNSSGNFDEMNLVSMISPGTVILSQDFGDSDVGVRHQVSVPVAMGTPTIQEYDYSKVGVWISSNWDAGVTETRNGVEYKLFTKTGLSSGGDSGGQPKYKLVF